MSFKDHFSRLAAGYSAFRPSYPPVMFEFLGRVCAERGAAWDCACGTGQATLALAEWFDAVVATDASAQQVAAAPAHPKVTYRTAPAEDSGIESNSIDLVTVAQALHWFDLEPFYDEVRRVLKPSAVLAVWTYGPLHVEGSEMDALFQEFYHDIVGPYWPPERRHVENGYRDLTFPFLELESPSFNMQVSWDRSRLLGYLRTWSATGRYVDALGVDPVAALEERLEPIWPDMNSTRTVTWPLAVRVGRKT